MKSQQFQPNKYHLKTGRLDQKKSIFQYSSIPFNSYIKNNQITANQDLLLLENHFNVDLVQAPVHSIASSSILQRAGTWGKSAWSQPLKPEKKQTWGEAFPTVEGKTDTPQEKAMSIIPTAVPEHMKATGITYKSNPQKQLQESENLATVKAKLKAWDRQSQEGCFALLTQQEINELVKFAQDIKTKSGKNSAFSLLRTSGELKYQGRTVIKIINSYSETNPKATYHVQITGTENGEVDTQLI
jgi:hypothetical protein